MKTCLLYTVCDRTNLLEKSLARVAELTLPDEVLVIDDGGTDDCQAVCETASIDCPVRYLYLDNPGQTLCSKARNFGINNTDCDFVITCEPEMLFRTDVISQMHVDRTGHPLEVISAGTVYHQQGPHSATETVTEGWVAPFIALYRREWLLDVGGWDESFPDFWGWEDSDLLTRIRVYGVGQFIDNEIQATHQWHPSRACDQARNEAHFRAKGLDEENTAHVVANLPHDP